jgi:hypothetical protein
VSQKVPLSRILWSVVAPGAGLVVGAITTTYHSAWFPWGLVVGILLVGVFVVSLRIISATRVPATLATAGVIVAMTMLAGLDDQGSVMIVGNTAGLTFLGSVTFVSLVALAWPKLTLRPTGYDGVSRTERTSRP